MLKKIDLKNKTALVTGAGKGLGKACSIALAEAGSNLILISRTQKDLDSVSKIAKKYKVKSKTYVCDLTNYMKLKKIVEEQNAYSFLDSEPQTLAAKEHRPPYGKDGDYFTKPSAEDIFEKVYSMMHEFDPSKFPSLY